MATKKKAAGTSEPEGKTSSESERIDLTKALSQKAVLSPFSLWLVGMSPLICHAWSEKARRQILDKHVKATKPGKEVRDPRDEYERSLYDLPDGKYGFPVTAIKKSIWSVAHKDKGIPKTTVQQALYIIARWHNVRPALAGAHCNMPLCQIYGSDPVMREDMVKIGVGVNKTAALAYRGSFDTWAIKIYGRLNQTLLPAATLVSLINEAGMSIGIGEWRNEKSGMFGSYRMAFPEEQEAWDAYAAGAGPLPVNDDMREIA